MAFQLDFFKAGRIKQLYCVAVKGLRKEGEERQTCSSWFQLNEMSLVNHKPQLFDLWLSALVSGKLVRLKQFFVDCQNFSNDSLGQWFTRWRQQRRNVVNCVKQRNIQWEWSFIKLNIFKMIFVQKIVKCSFILGLFDQ